LRRAHPKSGDGPGLYLSQVAVLYVVLLVFPEAEIRMAHSLGGNACCLVKSNLVI
jgi:hypothetical protein